MNPTSGGKMATSGDMQGIRVKLCEKIGMIVVNIPLPPQNARIHVGEMKTYYPRQMTHMEGVRFQELVIRKHVPLHDPPSLSLQ